MHELSIVLEIVNIAKKEFLKSNNNKIDLIELEIGALSGVELRALEYAWEPAVKDTVLEYSNKKINFIEGEAKCNNCKNTFSLSTMYDTCPLCDSFLKEIIKGKELRVKSIEVS